MTLLLGLVLLHGHVTLGPTAPVCRAGTPCSKPAAHVTLTFRRPGRAIRAVTDGRGDYRISLAPGTWTMRASVGMFVRPRQFAVPRARSATQNFAIDTGIR